VGRPGGTAPLLLGLLDPAAWRARAVVPPQVPYTLVHATLLGLLVLLIVTVASYGRRLSRDT
jgi:hypothetical protein